MSIRQVYGFIACLACVSVLLVGCGGPLEMVVSGESDLNSGGNAAVIRVYELSGTSNFRTTPLGQFWQDDQAALGDQYVNHQQFLLYPNQVERLTLDVSDETSHIGIAADLREPDENTWRTVYPVEDLKGRDVVISVGAHGLSTELD